MTPQETLIHHARSFAPAARLLAPDDYRRIARLYALCRTVDDLADTLGGPQVQGRLIAVTDDLRQHRPMGGSDPLAVEARALFQHRPAGLSAFADLVQTAANDTAMTCIVDNADLDRYCTGVAGTVGVMVCTLFDIAPKSHRAAADLGRAMQLTNICRDVMEDAHAGRRYLPFTLCPHTPCAIVAATPQVRADVRNAIAELLARADVLYANGRLGLPGLPLRLRLAVAAAAAMYAGIGDELRARSCDPYQGRVFVSKWRKLLLATNGIRSNLRAPKSVQRGQYNAQH